MKTGTIRRRAGLVCFAIGAAALRGILFHPQVYAQEAPKHTVFYTHGRIYTNDPAEPWAEAMAVADGKIVCIGKMAHVLLDCGGSQQSAETVHLNEHFVMPGFNDAHVHLGSAGADALAVELRGVKSPEEMQKRVAEAVAHHKEGEWITGSGWDHTLWPDKRFPNRQQLDAVAPKNPVILTHISGHVAVANSLALKKAEIDKSTPNPPGGEIEHDGLGEPTGMLKEAAAMALVRVRIPDPSMEERRRGLEVVLANVARNGVTSALVVKSGWNGVDDIFSGADNFFLAYAPKAQPERLVEKLGERYEIVQTDIKKWTVGSPIQGPLDAVENLRGRRPFEADQVERVVVRLAPTVAAVVDNRDIPDICLQHMVAVMLLDKTASFKAAHDKPRMQDTAVLRQRAKVQLVHDETLARLLPVRVAVVELTLTDGTRLTERVEAVRGTPRNPMSRAEVIDKCKDLIAPVLGSETSTRLIETVFAIETMTDIRRLRPLLQRG